MSNGDDQQQVNCVLEACCGEDKPKQVRAMTAWLKHHVTPLSDHEARAVAVALCGAFDFAEVGTLYAFKESIIKLSRGKPFEG